MTRSQARHTLFCREGIVAIDRFALERILDEQEDKIVAPRDPQDDIVEAVSRRVERGRDHDRPIP